MGASRAQTNEHRASRLSTLNRFRLARVLAQQVRTDLFCFPACSQPFETVLKTEAAEPVHYKFSKQVTYVNANGRVIDASKIRKDSKVRVHYVKDGEDMLVDKVIVTKDRD